MFQQNNHKTQSIDTNFKVFGRIRPFSLQQSKIASTQLPFSHDEKSITINIKNSDHCFVYDKIHGPQTAQQQIFNSVAKNAIQNSFLGINSTILCYGQTSSGKTHTIVGDFKSNTLQNQGLLPRILREVLFKRITILQTQAVDIRIKISMLEIYNQKLIDLLTAQRQHFRLRETKKKGVYVENLTQKYILTPQQGISIIMTGLQQRTVGRTNQNVNSSRSHMMIQITVIQNDFVKKQAKSAKIILVDLAGSQRLSRAGIEGKMIYETKKINLSLSTLGKVIIAITDPSSKHIPYRDSKLTRLLKQSIGGNSLTSLIVNISPSIINKNETISSLRFGARAKMIRNRPKINKEFTVQELLKMLEKAQQKIQQLLQYVAVLEKALQSGKNDRRLTERLKTQRPAPFSLQMIDIQEDQKQPYDNMSQSSTSKMSSSVQDNIALSQTLGSESCEMLNDIQARLEQFAPLKLIRNSQSCLNLHFRGFDIEQQRNERLRREKMVKKAMTPKNFKYFETKEQDEIEEKEDKKIKSIQTRNMVEIFKIERNNNILDSSDYRKDSVQHFILNEQEKQQELDLKLKKLESDKLSVDQNIKQDRLQHISSVIDLTLKSEGASIFESYLEKDSKLTTLTIELDEIRQMYRKSQEKLAKYKAIIKEQNVHITELKEKHKAKKMRLSKQISHLQHLLPSSN